MEKQTKENTFTSMIKNTCLGEEIFKESPLAADELIHTLQEKIIVWEETALKLAEIADQLKAENKDYKQALDAIYNRLNRD